MKGTFGVDSTVGRGSTFWFELELRAGTEPAPGDGAEASGQTAFARAAASPASQESRALVVEDNAVNRKLLVALLGKMGIRADTVENGR